MKNGIKERKDGRKKRGKKSRNLEQIHVYQIRRIRQNFGSRPDIRIKYGDQTHRKSTLNGENDKNIVFGERIDFDPPIG